MSSVLSAQKASIQAGAHNKEHEIIVVGRKGEKEEGRNDNKMKQESGRDGVSGTQLTMRHLLPVSLWFALYLIATAQCV